MTQAIKTVLHVGCGPSGSSRLHPNFRSAEWREIRQDINPRVKPDIVGSMIDLSTVADGSVDAVWCCHALEHLASHEVPLALREFLRVLKPDGFALIVVPDLQKVAELVARGDLDTPVYTATAGTVTAIDMIYGFRRAIEDGDGHMMHRTGFVHATLGRALCDSGFAGARIWRRNGYHLMALAARSAAMLPGMMAGVDSDHVIRTPARGSGAA